MSTGVWCVLWPSGTTIPVTVTLMAHKASPFLRLLLVDPLHPPVLHPFPHISQHVQMTKGSWGVGSDRAGAFKPIFSSVGCWKLSLPGVCPMLAPWLPLVAPRVKPILLASPASSLPLGLTWQSLTSPPATIWWEIAPLGKRSKILPHLAVSCPPTCNKEMCIFTAILYLRQELFFQANPTVSWQSRRKCKKQTSKQTNKQVNKQTSCYRQTNRQTNKQVNRQIKKQTKIYSRSYEEKLIISWNAPTQQKQHN